MKKKFLGVSLGTILAFILCLVVSVAIWLVVKYISAVNTEDVTMQAIMFFRG